MRRKADWLAEFQKTNIIVESILLLVLRMYFYLPNMQFILEVHSFTYSLNRSPEGICLICVHPIMVSKEHLDL